MPEDAEAEAEGRAPLGPWPVSASPGARHQVEHERRTDGHRGQRARHRQRHRAADPPAPSAGAGRRGRGDGEGEPARRGTSSVPRFRRRMRGGRPGACRGSGTTVPGRPTARRRHDGRRPEPTTDRPGQGRPGQGRPGRVLAGGRRFGGHAARTRGSRGPRPPAQVRPLPTDGLLKPTGPEAAPAAGPPAAVSRFSRCTAARLTCSTRAPGSQPPATRRAAPPSGEAAGDVGRGRAGGRLLVEARLGHLAQIAGQPVQLGRLVHHPVEQRRRGVAREGRRAGRGVREDRAQGEDVRRGGHALAEDLLGDM